MGEVRFELFNSFAARLDGNEIHLPPCIYLSYVQLLLLSGEPSFKIHGLGIFLKERGFDKRVRGSIDKENANDTHGFHKQTGLKLKFKMAYGLRFEGKQPTCDVWEFEDIWHRRATASTEELVRGCQMFGRGVGVPTLAPSSALEQAMPWILRRIADLKSHHQAINAELLSRGYRLSDGGVTESVAGRTSEDRYYFPGGSIAALKLFGADDVFVPLSRFRATYRHEHFEVHHLLKDKVDRHLKRIETQSKLENRGHFNGPNTRLLAWNVAKVEERRVALEERILEVELGPVSWFDFIGLNAVFSDDGGYDAPYEVYEWYTGLGKVLRERDLSESKVATILDTATTLVTIDCFVAYAVRSQQVIKPGYHTSAIAENINRYLDDAPLADPRSPHHIAGNVRSRAEPPDEGFRPGLPHPFAAVLRGIGEETSPSVLTALGQTLPVITGLSFDLKAGHPDLLFAIAIPLTAREIADLCRAEPGRDFYEGKLHFVPADLNSETTLSVLQERSWNPGGQASFLRALELIKGLKRSRRWRFDDVFEYLAGEG